MIGFGHVARNSWLPTLRAAGFHCSVYDIDIEARSAANEAGCKVYDYLPPAANYADFALILTPSPRHAADATSALRAGYHVLLEKPATTTIQEWIGVSSLAESLDRVALAAPLTYAGAAAGATARIINSSRLGELASVQVHLAKPGPFLNDGTVAPNRIWFLGPDAGPARDFAPYPLALLVYLLGPMADVRWSIPSSPKQEPHLLTGRFGDYPFSGVFSYSHAPARPCPVMLTFSGGTVCLDSEAVDVLPTVDGVGDTAIPAPIPRTKYALALQHLLASLQDRRIVEVNHQVNADVILILEKLGNHNYGR